MLWRIDANERTKYTDFPMGAGKEGAQGAVDGNKEYRESTPGG